MSDKPIFEQRIEGEVNFGGKDIIERLHGPEIIQQLQQENQILRDNLRLAHARLDNTLKDWPADVKDSTIEQLQQENQALRKDLEHLKKAEIAFREIISQQDYLAIARNSELTRLREALKKIAECEWFSPMPEIARKALAPQEGKQE